MRVDEMRKEDVQRNRSEILRHHLKASRRERSRECLEAAPFKRLLFTRSMTVTAIFRQVRSHCFRLGSALRFRSRARRRGMHRTSTKNSLSDDALGWVGIALGLIAAVILDKGAPPHKWHAAIMWTFLALFGVLIWGRQKRNSRLFWLFWSACFVFHAIAMWVIFGQLLPRLILGTLYVVPFAFVESLLLFVLFLRLERRVVRHKTG